jgi:nicotinate-nucleotide pyrophosphorylase (carboxylating)
MTAPTPTPNYADLLPRAQIDALVQQWMQDDHPSFDVGGLVVGNATTSARLLLKSPGVFAGKPFFDAVFEQLGCKVEWEDSIEEGAHIDASGSNKICMAVVTGPVNNLLRGERTALNTLSRCSGVATASRKAREAAGDWKGWVAGTRKTTPGFRVVEKYGLLVGGAATHRLDLSQMVMLKDNHIWSAGSITAAVQLARKAAGFSQKIEVECQSFEEAMEAAGAGADIVMLDNFEPEQLKKDAKAVKEKYPHILVEASGGITTETMPQFLSEHVDIVSQGKLTQGYACLDYSLKIVH